MQIRQLRYQDYLILHAWWEQWKWTPPHRDFLPENGTGGFMIHESKGGNPVAAGFMYLTNSKVAWIEFIVSNPQYKGKDRAELIQQLITYLIEQCRELGYEYAYTSTKNAALINKFESAGFAKGTVGSTELVMKLN